jgi:hypothetical protein
MSSEPSWRKSSHSGGEGGNCAEAASVPGAVLVRDTADRQGPALAFTPRAWEAFARKVKATA